MRGFLLVVALLMLAACEPARGNQGLSEVLADGQLLEVAYPDGSGPEGVEPDSALPDTQMEGAPEVVEAQEAGESTTQPFVTAEPWPAPAAGSPRIRLALAAVDNSTRSVTLEVVLEGDLELSGLAFSLPFDPVFLAEAQASPVDVLGDTWEGRATLLSAIRPGAPAVLEHGNALLRKAQLSAVEVYYLQGPLSLPTRALGGSHVLSRLTFHVPAAGASELVFPEHGVVAKDALFQAIPLARQGLRLTAQ
jgi:hypothetical protein